MKRNYMVAVCDILGFASFVTKNELNDVVGNSFDWFRKVMHHSIHKKDFPENVPSLKEIESHDKLGFAWFSDTVFLYTLRDDIDCYRTLCATISWLVFETMSNPHMRIRCGISYGEAHID
ncbi:MAG TPA: hypothetical protein ENH82_15280, partial [bacterium]|nr:hypothetical protein [bacterium]